MKRELLIFWTMIKGLFVCQHYASDLTVDELVEHVRNIDGDMEVWMTKCTCKCGETNVEQKFAFGTGYLARTFDTNGKRIRSS